MNLVLDDAEEVHMKTKNRKPLGKSELRIFTFLILSSHSPLPDFNIMDILGKEENCWH